MLGRTAGWAMEARLRARPCRSRARGCGFAASSLASLRAALPNGCLALSASGTDGLSSVSGRTRSSEPGRLSSRQLWRQAVMQPAGEGWGRNDTYCSGNNLCPSAFLLHAASVHPRYNNTASIAMRRTRQSRSFRPRAAKPKRVFDRSSAKKLDMGVSTLEVERSRRTKRTDTAGDSLEACC